MWSFHRTFDATLENGKIAQVKNLKNGKGFGSTEFIVLRGKEGITDTDFVYYLVTNKAFRENAERLMVGTSGRQRVDKQQFEDQIISIPDLETQKRISSILGSIDRKIELNVEMNKTLEEMAMTLYKHWFVDFGPFQDGEFRESELGMIPKGWKVIRLEEIITLKHGYAFKSKQFSDEENEKVVVRMGNFKEGPGLQFLDNTKFLIDDSVDEKYKLKPNDLVIVLSDVTREGRIIGRAGFIPEDHREYWLNQRVAKIETEKMYKYLLYCLFNSDLFRHHCITSANSTTVLNLKNEHLYNYKIALPDDKVIFEFNKKMETIIRLILENEQQNISLMHTRDYLLPRLLSGEIDVSQAEKQVEEVL
ncbi:restriction endonuclease subunit S [Geobacillus proteiniphilus]|uniref:Restriction endonuclease subunit S n=1 Tax=Geobacillus proteiniphilus TaxID=860353 RepID=A0ABY9MAR1_9BACL|nr:restriction endonuclease subunit S [Geobacillus proteiniphilus]WMJ15112.1 restriction endonuclease subunit S [Geobacillus proteiniphilus]